MKGLRITIALAAIAGAASCKGATGGAGDPGPIGTVAAAPRIDFVSIPYVTHGATLTVFGANLAAVTSSNGAASVLMNGHAADILASDATSITFTHAVADDPALYFTNAELNVVVNGLASNSLQVEILRPGTNLGLAEGAFRTASSISVDASGNLISVDTDAGYIDSISPAGDVTNAISLVDNNALKAWHIGSDYWVYTGSNRLERYDSNGGFVIVATMPSGFIDGAWDAAAKPNLYGLRSNGTVVKWDGTTNTVTDPFVTATNGGAFTAHAMTRMGNSLYIVDQTNAAVVAVNTGTLAQSTYVANGAISLTGETGLANDGTNLYLFSGGNLTKIDNTGTPAPLSTLHADNNGGNRWIEADSTGKVYVLSDTNGNPFINRNWIARYSADGLSIEPWAAFSSEAGYANIGLRTFDGSMTPILGGSSDITTGVLYEFMPDGTLRRVTGKLENGDVYSQQPNWPYYGHVAALKVGGGKLWALNYNTGDITSIDPASGAVVKFYDNVLNAGISNPVSIDFDAAGNAYVGNSDPVSGNYAVAKFSAAGVLVDSGWAFPPYNDVPSALAVQGTRLIAFDDCDYCELWTVPLAATAGTHGTYLRDGSGTGNGALFVRPYAMDTDAAGNIQFVDNYNNPEFRSLASSNELSTSVFDANSVTFGHVDPSGIILGETFSRSHVMVLP